LDSLFANNLPKWDRSATG
jgi:hypothetical protein